LLLVLERKKKLARFICGLKELLGKRICQANDYINNFPGGLFKMLRGKGLGM
jgi:hypothetical protein